MQLVDAKNDSAVLALSLNDLLTIKSAMNEVCNGLDLHDFETRMGTTRDEAIALMEGFSNVIQAMENSEPV